MTSQITGFRISGLHGTRDVRIEISDNCVVLVGVNGLGKTTIINMLFYLLTGQWVKLMDYQFEAIAIDVADRSISISRSQIEDTMRGSQWRRRISRYSPHLAELLTNNPPIVAAIANSPNDPGALRYLADDLHVPLHVLVDFKSMLEEVPLQRELFSPDAGLKQISDLLGTGTKSQVLYLPTYRRIERDLETIFPGLEEHIQRNRNSRLPRQTAYLEFVEFGMGDVEKKFSDILTSLKDRARSELNSLAASYLGEVIRGEAESYDRTVVASLDAGTINRILSRVEERDFLGMQDKLSLRTAIERLKSADTHITVRDKYVGHFFSKLVSINQSLATSEAAIASFVEVCNRYLVGKKVVFDDRAYTISIIQKPGDKPLELRHLSSGEKQIVSLFAHIYLGESSDLFVLIDEPELSLSVPWQKQLLPDITSSGRCGFLAAVTHSPFIYDNDLLKYATDLRRCIFDR